MREIKFRGKRIDNGEWVYGDLYRHDPPLQCVVPENYIPEQTKNYILKTAFADWNMPRQVEYIEVIPETIGQYTGLKDKNGVEIYEGDIVLHYSSGHDRKTQLKYCTKKTVVFENGTFEYARPYPPESGYHNLVEVIGNIHEGVTE